MEVLFAIAVLTIGLLGVAAILPVATNNASSALRDDRASEEVNNRVATDLARLSEHASHLTEAENAEVTANGVTGFNNGAGGNGTRQRYYDRPLNQLPRAFCIDPWFLTAANNLRPNTSAGDLNGYDRTYFPCYDPNYVPFVSPSAQMSDSRAVRWTWPYPAPSGRSVMWNTPRFARMSLPGVTANSSPSFVAARANATSNDDLSVVVSADSTRGAGLFVQRSTNAMRSLTRPTVTGRYSSFVMMSRSSAGSSTYDAAVVTMQDRRLVTVPGGDVISHQLAPYIAADPDEFNPADNQLTYPGEVMGYVTYAPTVFTGGGGGEFIFRTSEATKPNVRSGGWVCLMRQQYNEDPAYIVPPTPARGQLFTPVGTAPVFDSNPTGKLHFAWYRISDVVAGPTRDSGNGYWETQLAVRGSDWVFHPSQVIVASQANTQFSPPYSSSLRPPNLPANPSIQPPAYSFDDTGHPDFGTVVVVMPDVISVQQFPFEF